MTRTGAARPRYLAPSLLAAAAVLGLAGCGSIDNMLFGGAADDQAPPSAVATANPGTSAPAVAAGASQSATAPVEAPEGPASASPGAGAPPPPATTPPAPVATAALPPPAAAGEFAPVSIAPGTATGTTVGHTVESLRSQLEGLEAKLQSGAQQLADLRASGVQESTSYQQAAGQVSGRLGAGTTPGNPELIGQWNGAQAALNSLTGNINALATLASDVSANSRAAHNTRDAVEAAFTASGGVDEDRRQLSLLSDATSEVIMQIDRLLGEVKQTLRSETAYVANERGNLVRLAAAIRAGEYGATGAEPRARVARAPAAEAAPEAAPVAAAASASGSPIVTIKFDRAHVSYDRELYAALSQALAVQPSASFSVVGVAPAEGGTEIAANTAQHDARAVMRSMGAMGVPTSRMSVSASTDSGIAASEVRVYVR